MNTIGIKGKRRSASETNGNSASVPTGPPQQRSAVPPPFCFFEPHEETPEERAARRRRARLKRQKNDAKSIILFAFFIIIAAAFLDVEFEYKKLLIGGVFFVLCAYLAITAIKDMQRFFLNAVGIVSVILAIYTFLPLLLGMSVSDTLEYTMGHEEKAFSLVKDAAVEHGKFPLGIVVGAGAAWLFFRGGQKKNDDE